MSVRRVGSFQYMKLPLELRHKVLRYLIAPFVEEKYGAISVGVDYIIDDKRKVREYLQKRNEEDATSLAQGLKSYLKSLEKRQNDDRRHKEEIKAFIRDNEWIKYDMGISIYKENYGPNVLDLPMIDLLRNLSNVSTNFREEFGSIFWANIWLRLWSGTLEERTLQCFLKERPAIHKRIGRLEVPVELWLHNELDAQTLNNIKSEINYLPKSLEIRHFVLEVFIKEEELPDLAAGTGVWKLFKAIQRVKVTVAFDLILTVMANGFWWDDDEELAYCTEVSREHVPTILRFITPNTLRSPDQKELSEGVCCRIRIYGGGNLPDDDPVCAKTLKQWEAELQMNNPKNLDD
jgi:hypothetical protein